MVSNVRVEGIADEDEVLLVGDELLVEDCEELDEEEDEEVVDELDDDDDDDDEVKGKDAVDTEEEEDVELVSDIVGVDAVVVVDFTLEIATYAAPAAIKTITTMTATISAALERPVFERFKLN